MKTDTFPKTILVHGKKGGEWAIAVQGAPVVLRLIFAQCVKFPNSSGQLILQKDETLEDHRTVICTFLEEIDEEQLTISDLVVKMGEYLCN